MNVNLIKSKSADIMKSASTDYQNLRAADKKAKAETLKPGESLGYPTFSNFYIEDYRNICDEKLSGYREQIKSLLEEVRAEIKTKSVEPPTNEQTNLLTVLSIGKPTQEELQNALDKNTGNFATFSAIHRIAVDNGIYLDETNNPLHDLQSLQMQLANNEKSLYTDNADTSLSASYQDFSQLMSSIF